MCFMIPFPWLAPVFLFPPRVAAQAAASAPREKRCSLPRSNSISRPPRFPQCRILPSGASRRRCVRHGREPPARVPFVCAARCSASGVPASARHRERGSRDRLRYRPRFAGRALDGAHLLFASGACRELPVFLIGPQKSLLDNFFGVVLIPGHAKGQPERVVAVPLDENAKGIALARERALDGEGVASCDGLGALDALLHPIH